MGVRVVNRPGHQLLGANGRDDGALVSIFHFCFYMFFLHELIPHPRQFSNYCVIHC